jgi:hypothetical protein
MIGDHASPPRSKSASASASSSFSKSRNENDEEAEAEADLSKKRRILLPVRFPQNQQSQFAQMVITPH